MLSPILLATASTPMWLTWQSQNPTGNALYTTPSPKGCAGLSCRLDVAYMPQSAPINRSQPVPCALTSVALPGWCMHKILNIFEPQIHCNESVEVQAGITKNHTTRTGFRCAAKNWNLRDRHVILGALLLCSNILVSFHACV